MPARTCWRSSRAYSPSRISAPPRNVTPNCFKEDLIYSSEPPGRQGRQDFLFFDSREGIFFATSALFALKNSYKSHLPYNAPMLAICMTRPGGPEVLEARELPVPELPGPHHALVRLHAAGVNPIDTKLRKNGTYYPDRLPAILGCDGAGVVEAVGAAVTRFRPGDEVYFCHGGIGAEPGNYARYNVVPEDCLASKPKSLSFTEAAAGPPRSEERRVGKE